MLLYVKQLECIYFTEKNYTKEKAYYPFFLFSACTIATRQSLQLEQQHMMKMCLEHWYANATIERSFRAKSPAQEKMTTTTMMIMGCRFPAC